MKEGVKRCAHTCASTKASRAQDMGAQVSPEQEEGARLRRAFSRGPRSSQNPFTPSSGMETGVCHHRQWLGPWSSLGRVRMWVPQGLPDSQGPTASL